MKVQILVVLFLCGCLSVYGAATKPKNGAMEKTKNNEDTHVDFVTEEPSFQNDEDYDGEYGVGDDELNSDNYPNPIDTVNVKLETKSVEVVAKIGDTVTFPCKMPEKETVHSWKKEETPLYQEWSKLSEGHTNIKEHNNASLEIKINSDEDFGDYTCILLAGNSENPQVTHKIHKETPPKIVSVYTENHQSEFEVGETVKLKCKAEGWPKPKISWHKNGERVGLSGDPGADTLIIENIKANQAGTYQCFADNKIIRPAHGVINVNVRHKPIISIEKYVVSSDQESDVEIKCTVYAYPSATVQWRRNGENIKADPPKLTLKRHQNNVENILNIKDLKDEDFGNYSCYAKNAIGKAEKSITLVKIPVVQGFIKPEKINKDVVLTWKVESKSPIVAHELSYRKQGGVQWTEIAPEVTNSVNDIYTVKHTLKGLEPGIIYETRVRSQNQHGWSEYSDPLDFEGVMAKHKHHSNKKNKEKDIKVKQNSPSTESPSQHQRMNANTNLIASQTAGTLSTTSTLSTIGLSLAALLIWNRV